MANLVQLPSSIIKMAKNQKIQLEVIGLSYSQTQTGAYALILGEKKKQMRLPIIIGTTEAQAIAIQLEGLSPKRPLTHDLFRIFAKEFNIKVTEINILKLEEGIFYSEITLEGNGIKTQIDSRTSDAIAIALRFEAPIFCQAKIMKKAGILLNPTHNEFEVQESNDFNIEKIDLNDLDEDTLLFRASFEDLDELMNRALHEENYEAAGKIRDIVQLKTDLDQAAAKDNSDNEE